METIEELRDRSALEARVRAGWKPEYLFFWGHTASGGSVGKECLSQWYPADFTVDGLRYPTAEHYMMAEKARLFGDAAAARRVLESPDPRAAKEVGRSVRGFDEATWQARRLEIVIAGNEAKFGQHPDLRSFLLGTKERVLVEASPTDTVWGIGLEASDRRAMNPTAWRGLNLLGFALMVVRARLRSLNAT